MAPNTFLGEFEQMVLLAILQTGERAFALEVRREIEASARRKVSRGGFYTTLERLESKGLVRWSEQEPPGPGRAARLRRYTVTPQGVDALRESRRAVEALSRGLEALIGPVAP